MTDLATINRKRRQRGLPPLSAKHADEIKRRADRDGDDFLTAALLVVALSGLSSESASAADTTSTPDTTPDASPSFSDPGGGEYGGGGGSGDFS